MHLSYQHGYDASADTVVALMANPEFLADVAEHAGATSHEVRIVGSTTHIEMSLEAPSDVARFVGKTIRVKQSLTWGQPDAQGVRRGTVDIDVAGLPVTASAAAVLSPTGPNSSAGTYKGELTVRIPLVGKKVEALVAPSINEAFDGIERRAQEWLAR